MVPRNLVNLTSASRILFKQENYAYKILQPTHTEESINLLTTSFSEGQPLTNAYYQAYPLQHSKKIEKWKHLWRFFADEFTTNGISVGCFDSQRNDEMVGISIAKDLTYVPLGFDEHYMKNLNFISPIVKLEEHLFSKVDQKISPLLSQKEAVMDIWVAGVKRDHNGKGMLGKMMKANMLLGHEAGFTHAFCYATNFKTAMSLQKLKFHKIAQENASKFEAYGICPFREVGKEDENTSIWLKKLEPVGLV